MNPNIVASYALMAELQRSGVTHAVISPGSRSTPLSYVAHELFETTIVIDERSAGFVALGIAESTGRVPVIITTSGSAPTHLFPSVVEAYHSQLGMIVLSADRPHEVRGRGAPQTIDQIDLFAHSTRLFIDTECPHDNESSEYWTRIGRDSYEAAMGVINPPGPVQINIGLREPLSPDGDESLQGPSIQSTEVQPLQGRTVQEECAELPISFGAERGLITIGRHANTDKETLNKFSRVMGWPICADVMSGCRDESVITTYDSIVRSTNADQYKPDVICEIGEPLTSKKFNEFVSGVPTIALRNYKDSRDPYTHHSDYVLTPDIQGQLEYWSQVSQRTSTWGVQWELENERVKNVIENTLQSHQDSEARVMSDIGKTIAQTQTQAKVLVASSMPIRFAEWLWSQPSSEVEIFSHRGTNGIDGMIASTYGIATGSNVPSICVLGDVAFAHDLGFLPHAQQLSIANDRSLLMIIIDNDGGAIFRHLPQANNETLKDSYESLFRTSPGLDVEKHTLASGAKYSSASAESCGSALANWMSSPRKGVSVLHVVVDHESGPDFMKDLQTALTE